ncbi:MAG: hypothetical protein HQM00_09835 [Magnetococcales bacterium]|nr:hypothetical protein [Magnetococcales bacterium]
METNPTALIDLPPDRDPSRPDTRPMGKRTLCKRVRTPEEAPTRHVEANESLLDRARELADKGMFKEALLLWERAMRQGIGASFHPATPLVWMINARQYTKGIRHFMSHEPVLRYDHPALWSLTRELFAVAALTLDTDTRQLPPWNLPPWNQAQTLLQAMQAWERGEEMMVQTILVAIDRDSPFLAGRRILESLMMPAHAPERILALLGEIPDASPFAPLAALARTRAMTPTERIPWLLDLPLDDRATAARLCGAHDKWIKLLLKLERGLSAGRLVTLLLAHAESLPRLQTRALCLNLLPECLEERAPFEKRFGPLEEFERERLFALHHERQRSHAKAIGYWKKCALLLENSPPGEERSLRIALLHRRMALLEQREPHPSTPQILQYLEKSLEYDPDHKPTWLELLQIRSRLGRERHLFHRLADQAARRFPDDEGILALVMAAAMEKGSFKKASGVARRIHTLNPGHDDILATRVSAHLQHARKRILEGEFAVARRELVKAERLRADDGTQPVGLLAAMLEFLAGDPERGEEILEAGRQQATQKTVHAVKAFLEASALRVPALILDSFRRDLIRCDALPPDRDELVTLAGILTRHFPAHPNATTEAATLLSGHLRSGARLGFDPEETRLICEALTLTQRHGLLALYGRLGEKRWPGEPVFTYYRARGQCENQPWRLMDDDFQALMRAKEELQEKDPAAAAMIHTLLAIPASRQPLDPLRSIPLSPARIPKPLESKLLRELRARFTG